VYGGKKRRLGKEESWKGMRGEVIDYVEYGEEKREFRGKI